MFFPVFSRLLIATAVGCCSLPVMNAVAVDVERLVSTSIQDEVRKIPEDNTVSFSRADRKVRFQLVKFSGESSDMLAGTTVTVIDPNGTKSSLKADVEGIATLNNAKPGLHAFVVTGENGHTAVPIALRETNPPAAVDNEPEIAVETPTVKLPLMDIEPSELVRLTSSYLPPDMGGSYDDIDSQFVASGEVTQGLQYRVRLGDDGTLNGQVYSLLRNGLSTYGVEGTNILIYRGNDLVARTVADQFGKFAIGGMGPGVYGLCGIGAGGYAAFGFEAYNASAIAQSGIGQTLVSVRNEATELISTNTMQNGGMLPVVLIPPSMVPSVVQQIRNAFPPTDETAIGSSPLGSAAPGSGFGGGAGVGGAGPGGFGGGAVGAGAGIGGGAGGLLGLVAAGGIAAAAAGGNNNNNNDFIPPPATNGGL